jgi:hypothetical protein
MKFLNQVLTLIRFWRDWLYRCLVRFLGHKIGETCWGLNTRSEADLLSFLTPTQTHVFDAHSHGYGHFGTATCGVSSLLKNGIIEWVGALGMVIDSAKIMTF